MVLLLRVNMCAHYIPSVCVPRQWYSNDTVCYWTLPLLCTPACLCRQLCFCLQVVTPRNDSTLIRYCVKITLRTKEAMLLKNFKEVNFQVWIRCEVVELFGSIRIETSFNLGTWLRAWLQRKAVFTQHIVKMYGEHQGRSTVNFDKLATRGCSLLHSNAISGYHIHDYVGAHLLHML